jgi:hypothetical protein
MGLKDDLLTMPLEARFAYDAERNIFFLNMEGMSLVSQGEVQAIGTEVGQRLAVIGKKVQMVINYDNFYLDPALTDDYKAVVRSLAERHYASVTRYTTSSFMRLKLSEHLSDRGLAPHIYESRQEAMNWLGKQIPGSLLQNRQEESEGESEFAGIELSARGRREYSVGYAAGRVGHAERVPQAGEVDGQPCLRGHMVQERAHRFQSGQDFAPDLMRGTHRIHGNQDSALAVPRDNGGCHFMVEGEALGNDFCGVIGAMLERGSCEQPPQEFRIAGLEVQRHICGHSEFATYQVHRAGLLHVPRDAIEDEPASCRLRGDQCRPQYVEYDLVGHEFSAVEMPLNGQADRGPPGHVIAQQFTGRDVGDIEMGGDQCALGSLARARGRDHQHSHAHLLPSSSPTARPVDTSARHRRSGRTGRRTWRPVSLCRARGCR